MRARLWIEISGPSPADTHAGRSQAHHVARVCPEPPSSNDTFSTRLSLSDLQRTRDERRRGGAEDESYCLACTPSLYPPSPGGQLPSPLTGAPLPSSLPLSCATTPETSASEYAISLSMNQGNIYIQM